MAANGWHEARCSRPWTVNIGLGLLRSWGLEGSFKWRGWHGCPHLICWPLPLPPWCPERSRKKTLQKHGAGARIRGLAFVMSKYEGLCVFNDSTWNWCWGKAWKHCNGCRKVRISDISSHLCHQSHCFKLSWRHMYDTTYVKKCYSVARR